MPWWACGPWGWSGLWTRVLVDDSIKPGRLWARRDHRRFSGLASIFLHADRTVEYCRVLRSAGWLAHCYNTAGPSCRQRCHDPPSHCDVRVRHPSRVAGAPPITRGTTKKLTLRVTFVLLMSSWCESCYRTVQLQILCTGVVELLPSLDNLRWPWQDNLLALLAPLHMGLCPACLPTINLEATEWQTDLIFKK
eukprot:SAG11_NODE_1889_length_4112_cov_19.726888_3_plen_193_part_00